MMKYKFLFKPAFFICNLIFSCWMVLKIEQMEPSDFGKYEKFFKPDTALERMTQKSKKAKVSLKKLLNEYKVGLIDSTRFNAQFETLFDTAVDK